MILAYKPTAEEANSSFTTNATTAAAANEPIATDVKLVQASNTRRIKIFSAPVKEGGEANRATAVIVMLLAIAGALFIFFKMK